MDLRNSSLKEIDQYSGPHYGFILIPRGIPAEPNLFENRCLPIAFCIGRMISQAGYQGEKPVKKLLYVLKSLCQQKC